MRLGWPKDMSICSCARYCVGGMSRIFWHNLAARSCAPREDRSTSSDTPTSTMGTLPREWRIVKPITRTERRVERREPCTRASLLTCQLCTHQRRPLRRRSRCNCVNCTTHMIRIAFNYSSICEILSPYPLSRSSPSYARWHGVRAHSMVMRDERKGKRHEGDLANRKHVFNKTRFARYAFLARSIFYSSSIRIAFSLSNCLIYRNTCQACNRNWVTCDA